MVGYISGSTENFNLVNSVNGNLVGTQVSPANPRLVRLADYTTWTSTLWTGWDLHLMANSPAIDAGNNALAVDADGNPLQHDLDGYRRIANGTVDMGAYEYGSTIPAVSPTMPSNFRSTSKTKDTVMFVWNTAARATSYDIR